jgi:drug/metabolite transporter (DMT)-like permease
LEYWLFVALLGVFPSAVAYVTWSAAFQRAPRTSDVSNYMFITPFLSGLAGFIINGEAPDISTLLGGAVILSGVALFNYRPKRKAAGLVGHDGL